MRMSGDMAIELAELRAALTQAQQEKEKAWAEFKEADQLADRQIARAEALEASLARLHEAGMPTSTEGALLWFERLIAKCERADQLEASLQEAQRLRMWLTDQKDAAESALSQLEDRYAEAQQEIADLRIRLAAEQRAFSSARIDWEEEHAQQIAALQDGIEQVQMSAEIADANAVAARRGLQDAEQENKRLTADIEEWKHRTGVAKVWTLAEMFQPTAPFEYDQGDMVLAHWDELYDINSAKEDAEQQIAALRAELQLADEALDHYAGQSLAGYKTLTAQPDGSLPTRQPKP